MKSISNWNNKKNKKNQEEQEQEEQQEEEETHWENIHSVIKPLAYSDSSRAASQKKFSQSIMQHHQLRARLHKCTF